MTPSITILTPLYNRKQYIERLYYSLCAQTRKDFQWLTIDDGSEDYVYIYMGDNEVNSEYLSGYFFDSDSPFNEYLNDMGYRFTLSNQYFYSNKYCFIPIVR